MLCNPFTPNTISIMETAWVSAPIEIVFGVKVLHAHAQDPNRSHY